MLTIPAGRLSIEGEGTAFAAAATFSSLGTLDIETSTTLCFDA
jgi:hypothetical protein